MVNKWHFQNLKEKNNTRDGAASHSKIAVQREKKTKILRRILNEERLLNSV